MKKCIDDQIEQAHQEWLSALDALDTLIFMHDQNCRILRCNLAYQKAAGLPFEEIIGQPYFEIFPKTHTPLKNCSHQNSLSGIQSTVEEIQVNQTLFLSCNYAIHDAQKNHIASIQILEDITEKKHAEKQLLDSEYKHHAIFDAMLDGVIIANIETQQITEGNQALCDMLGYQHAELIKLSVKDLHPESSLPHVLEQFSLQAQGKIKMLSGVPIQRRDGSIFYADVNSSPLLLNDKPFLLGVFRDITDRQQREERLKLFRNLLDHSSDAIEVVDPNSIRFLDVNQTACQELGYTQDELLTMTVYDIDSTLNDPKKSDYFSSIKTQVNQSGKAIFETIHQRKDGSTFPVEVNNSLVELDRPYSINMVRNITERKKIQAELQKSNEKYRLLIETTSDLIWEINTQTFFTYVSPQITKVSGYTPDEVLGRTPFSFMPPQEAQRVGLIFKELSENKRAIKSIEHTNVCKNGDLKVLETSGLPFFDTQGNLQGYRGISRDITERKSSVNALNRANRALKTLSAGNIALVAAKTEDELIHKVTQVIVEKGGYPLSTVSYAQDDPEKNITLMAWAGTENHFFWEDTPSWAIDPNNQLALSKAITSGKTQILRDIATESKVEAWREAALCKGFISNIALPLTINQHTFGALSIYSDKVEIFDNDEVQLLEELAKDLSYGIATLRTRTEHQQYATQLNRALEQSIQTIADTIEARDPYTAGHQRRVAQLATAIAREMELPENQIKGIHFAAIIHDLGKIHIPAEILSNPGKLSEIEYMLIKTHPQAGYDIIKDVDFPWPIADIILQHHEKIDGTGYPQGLKGDQILLESKIVTVADVVEAMYSHRPYRVAKGMALAMNELSRGKGTAYDPKVVDICQKLIAEKRFNFNIENVPFQA